MLRTTGKGVIVWFRMESEPRNRIEWPLEIYLKILAESTCESDRKRKLYLEGKIEPISNLDLIELQGERVNKPHHFKKGIGQ